MRGQDIGQINNSVLNVKVKMPFGYVAGAVK